MDTAPSLYSAVVHIAVQANDESEAADAIAALLEQAIRRGDIEEWEFVNISPSPIGRVT